MTSEQRERCIQYTIYITYKVPAVVVRLVVVRRRYPSRNRNLRGKIKLRKQNVRTEMWKAVARLCVLHGVHATLRRGECGRSGTDTGMETARSSSKTAWVRTSETCSERDRRRRRCYAQGVGSTLPAGRRGDFGTGRFTMISRPWHARLLAAAVRAEKPYFPVSRAKAGGKNVPLRHPLHPNTPFNPQNFPLARDLCVRPVAGGGWSQTRRTSLTFSRPITGLFNHTRTPRHLLPAPKGIVSEPGPTRLVLFVRTFGRATGSRVRRVVKLRLGKGWCVCTRGRNTRFPLWWPRCLIKRQWIISERNPHHVTSRTVDDNN